MSQIKTISSLTHTGEVTTKFGVMQGFSVSFTDNTKGNVLAKSVSPAYKVGQQVSVDVTGNYQGIDKLKISTNLEGFAQPTAQQAPTAAPLPPAVLPGVSANLVPIHGASAGMAVKEAIPIVQMTMGGLEWKDMEDTEFWKKVHYVASRMINVMQHLESGHLAKVKTEPKPVAPPPPPAPAANDEDTSF